MRMMRTLLVALALLAMTACDDLRTAERVLTDQGYTHVQVKKRGWFQWSLCSESDTYESRFTAISPAGRPVSGSVCSGVMKGATIRFD